MGSGHFLVSLVDYLSDQVLHAMAEAQLSGHLVRLQSPVAPERPHRGHSRHDPSQRQSRRLDDRRRSSSTTATSSAAWCSSAASMASTRTRWRSNSPRSPCGFTPSPSARRSLSSTTICAAATACSAVGLTAPCTQCGSAAVGTFCWPARSARRWVRRCGRVRSRL